MFLSIYWFSKLLVWNQLVVTKSLGVTLYTNLVMDLWRAGAIQSCCVIVSASGSVIQALVQCGVGVWITLVTRRGWTLSVCSLWTYICLRVHTCIALNIRTYVCVCCGMLYNTKKMSHHSLYCSYCIYYMKNSRWCQVACMIYTCSFILFSDISFTWLFISHLLHVYFDSPL